MWELPYTVGITPHCAMYCTMPAVFSVTDFPPALGPDIRSMRRSGDSVISSGIISRPWLSSDIFRTGWHA